jgi:hypothetical protein
MGKIITRLPLAIYHRHHTKQCQDEQRLWGPMVNQPDTATDLRAAMRTGIAAVVRRVGHGLDGISTPKLIGLLSAGALAPLAAAGIPLVGPVLAAGLGLTGSAGMALLGELLTKAAHDATATSGPGTPQSLIVVERALADRIEELFAETSLAGNPLRTEVAAMFRQLDAVGMALDTAGQTGGRPLQSALATIFGELSAEFHEFAFILTDVQRAVWAIDEMLRLQETERRADRERARDDSAILRVALSKLAAIDARLRPESAAGSALTIPQARLPVPRPLPVPGTARGSVLWTPSPDRPAGQPGRRAAGRPQDTHGHRPIRRGKVLPVASRTDPPTRQ